MIRCDESIDQEVEWVQGVVVCGLAVLEDWVLELCLEVLYTVVLLSSVKPIAPSVLLNH